MALSQYTIAEVEYAGSDTANAGLFDPSQTAGMNTDGAATSATGATPVFTSASYNFVAGDVGAWLFIAAGTNWKTGWYLIALVASNAATLTAGVGTAVNWSTNEYWVNTVAGCATTASPTGATWTIDYSQQNNAAFTYTDLASVGAGLLVSSASQPFGKQQVGNGLLINGTGTGGFFTDGRYVIASIGAANVATVVGPSNITTGAGVAGTGALGGAMASKGQAGAVMQLGNDLFQQSNGSTAYMITSASSNVSGGCLTLPADASGANVSKFIGYGSVRMDMGTKPINMANSSITTFTLVTAGSTSQIINVALNGNARTGSTGFSLVSTSFMALCSVTSCVTRAYTSAGVMISCSATLCSGIPFVGSGLLFGCVAYNNTAGGFNPTGTSNWINCLSINNSGGSSYGFNITSSGAQCIGCTAYGNGSNGFIINVSGAFTASITNCYSESNGGYGYNLSGAMDSAFLLNCGSYGNTSGAYNTNFSPNQLIGFLNLSTSSAFNNPTNGDFSLNNTASAGAALRSAGIPGAAGSTWGLPGLTSLGSGTGTSSYPDIGAAQHQATGGSSTTSALISRIIQGLGLS